jgi:hypothetical protein
MLADRVTLSGNKIFIYLELDFEKGPVFGKFVVYRAGQDWVLVNFVFNTKEDLILPSCP